MMNFDSTAKYRKLPIHDSRSLSRSPPLEQQLRPRKPSDAIKSASAIPVIRTQEPSPTDIKSNLSSPKPPSSASDISQGRNWAELATFMRMQREKGFSEIRVHKNGLVRGTDSPKSGSTSPSLPLPSRPREPSRPSSPAGRPVPSRRYTDDEDWSHKRRPSPQGYGMNGNEKVRSQSTSGESRSPLADPSTRRRGPDTSSPLTFGARGANVKPTAQAGAEPPPLPSKAEKREKGRYEDRERRWIESERKHGELNGIGLGIQGHGVQERSRRI
jgi:hypothetical protein